MQNSTNDMVRLKTSELFIAIQISKAAQRVDIDVKHDLGLAAMIDAVDALNRAETPTQSEALVIDGYIVEISKNNGALTDSSQAGTNE